MAPSVSSECLDAVQHVYVIRPASVCGRLPAPVVLPVFAGQHLPAHHHDDGSPPRVEKLCQVVDNQDNLLSSRVDVSAEFGEPGRIHRELITKVPGACLRDTDPATVSKFS